MFPTRHELLTGFQNPVFTPHPQFSSLRTFSCIEQWKDAPAIVELPRLRVEVLSLDYLEGQNLKNIISSPLKFQQDNYRLWYQVEGNGILQNVTRSTFGTARPGLLGIMDRGERHTYLHQRGPFECFQLEFSLLPSQHAKCYWNTEIEGKYILDGNEKLYFENLIFDLLQVISNKKEILGMAVISRILEIMVVLFRKKLLLIDECQFPKNKSKHLVAKAKNFMNIHYADLKHQRDLEKECAVDINYLNILFKNETGKTLYQYITSVRMEYAKYLLESTSHSVSTIASQIGYPNGNSFTRAFRRFNALAPMEYRTKFGENKRDVALNLQEKPIPFTS